MPGSGRSARVESPSPHHLYWPDLDVDLAVESLAHPERYPLVSQAQPDRRLQSTKPQPDPAGDARPNSAFAADIPQKTRLVRIAAAEA